MSELRKEPIGWDSKFEAVLNAGEKFAGRMVINNPQKSGGIKQTGGVGIEAGGVQMVVAQGDGTYTGTLFSSDSSYDQSQVERDFKLLKEYVRRPHL